EDRGPRDEDRGPKMEDREDQVTRCADQTCDPRSSVLGPRSSVFLVGYRGTGKTAVARLLAERLGWEWVDADGALERLDGRTIREIFAAEGEAGFRANEEAVLADLCRGERRVIATGGGVVLREANRQRMRSAGRVVWLTADARTVWGRLQGDPTTAERRPAVAVGGLGGG